MANKILTQSELKRILHYNPDTGVFIYIKRTAMSNWIGKRAGGFIDKGYLAIRINYHAYREHRLAFLYMTGEFPNDQVDHIDHDRTNNKWSNLRESSGLQNSKNNSVYKTNKSGVHGVHWCLERNKWRVSISCNHKRVHLGRYDDFFEAVCVKKSAENKHGFHPNHGHLPSSII